jgi:hypothetical protein
MRHSSTSLQHAGVRMVDVNGAKNGLKKTVEVLVFVSLGAFGVLWVASAHSSAHDVKASAAQAARHFREMQQTEEDEASDSDARPVHHHKARPTIAPQDDATGDTENE